MRLLLVLALVLSSLLPASLRAQELGLPVGSTAPAAAVQTLDGKATNLSQWVGKTPVLIEFWASWCPNCKALEPAIEAAHRAYGDRVKFLGVAVSVNQSPERVRRHLARHAMPLEMVYDHEGEATSAYDVPATSYVVILDRTGRVVYTGLGDEQDLVGALRKAGL